MKQTFDRFYILSEKVEKKKERFHDFAIASQIGEIL